MKHLLTMNSLSLYKFIHENSVEFRWENRNENRDVLIFPSIWCIDDFNKLFSSSGFDDGGIKCTMMEGYFAFWMSDICDYYGIELTDVFGVDPELVTRAVGV